MSVKFSVKEKKDFTLVEFELDGAIAPSDLRDLKIPEIDRTKGVIISGRGPIWLYGTLVHHYHPTPWVGVFDPRLSGGVVVQSHTPGVAEGDIVPLSED